MNKMTCFQYQPTQKNGKIADPRIPQTGIARQRKETLSSARGCSVEALRSTSLMDSQMGSPMASFSWCSVLKSNFLEKELQRCPNLSYDSRRESSSSAQESFSILQHTIFVCKFAVKYWLIIFLYRGQKTNECASLLSLLYIPGRVSSDVNSWLSESAQLHTMSRLMQRLDPIILGAGERRTRTRTRKMVRSVL